MTPGPPPNVNRRRRNFPTRGDWITLPAELQKPVLRALPPREAGPWSERAKALWEAWRLDPATTQWTDADTYYALDTLSLFDLCTREPRSSLAAEVRLRMDGLGLTPKGKQSLRWRLADAEVVEHPTASRRSAQRRRLMAIDPKGAA